MRVGQTWIQNCPDDISSNVGQVVHMDTNTPARDTQLGNNSANCSDFVNSTWYGNSYLNKRQLAAQLQISIRQLEKLVDAKKIPVTRLGKRCVRFDPDSVKQALNLLEIKAVRRNTPHPPTKNPTQQISK